MAGIYLHIPFCKQACHYCDFHFSTSLKLKNDFLEALLQEAQIRKDYLDDATIETIYFGGGTPSLLSKEELLQIFDALNQHFSIAKDAEITLEANPDDLTQEKINALAQTPINRLSIGVQSFFEEDLRFMNRAHNAQEAKDSIKMAQKAGFYNLNIDLIYGLPKMTKERWKNNIQTFLDLNIPHLSAYCLTVEPNTALAHFIQTGKVAALDDDQAAEQFQILLKQLAQHGYLQYEISNFSLNCCESKHNSSYWKGKSYLGLGPSAHSFNGESRQWNVANNAHYIRDIKGGHVPAEREVLSLKQKYNEYVMTSLRTIWGCDLARIAKDFGQRFEAYFLQNTTKYEEKEWLLQEGNIWKLTTEGKLFADAIASDFFWTKE